MKYPTRVIVRNIETDDVIHDRTGDHDDLLFRKWMGKTAFWAVRNGHYMMTGPVTEEMNHG